MLWLWLSFCDCSWSFVCSEAGCSDADFGSSTLVSAGSVGGALVLFA